MIKKICDICGKNLPIKNHKETLTLIDEEGITFDFCSYEHLIQYAINENNKLKPTNDIIYGKKSTRRRNK